MIEIEKRSVISSLELRDVLAADRRSWIAFECVVDEDGKRCWKVLVVNQDGAQSIVITARAKARILKSADGVLVFYRDFYPWAQSIDLPIAHGAIRPDRAPTPPDPE
ncbi:MAG: hypothetical protein AAF322_00065 [Pseudomonadota bacterium]